MIVICKSRGDGKSAKTGFVPDVYGVNDSDGNPIPFSCYRLPSGDFVVTFPRVTEKTKTAIKAVKDVVVISEDTKNEKDEVVTPKLVEDLQSKYGVVIDPSKSKIDAAEDIIKLAEPAITKGKILETTDKPDVSPVIVVNGEVLGGK